MSFMCRTSPCPCVTHFARHRMQSPLFMPTLDALARGNYVLPETVAAIPEARAAYESAFREQTAFTREMLRRGLKTQDAAYCALSGHTADMLFSMNARELLHFFQLRTLRTRPVGDSRGGPADASLCCARATANCLICAGRVAWSRAVARRDGFPAAIRTNEER